MLTYIFRRVLGTIPVILLISLLVFMLVHAAPGDPADMLLSDEATKEDIDDARIRWGLDKPIYVQYGKFLVAALQGDLGAGKTCLVQGLAQGLGITEPITSPTFALAQHYRGQRTGHDTDLVHLDLYRLEQPEAAAELFAQEEEEALALEAVLAVEWPERLSFTPGPAWQVHLLIDADGRRALVQAPDC